MNNNYLYHYTNIETLALILKNHTIRFNSLDKMDDLEEKETTDLINSGQYVYVSCWTDDVRESIPMWNMYSSLESGVRIRMGRKPFRNDELIADSFTKGLICTEAFDIYKKNPVKIEYTSEKDKLIPSIVSYEGTSFTISTDKLGIYKNTDWAFQHEWRYILHVFPLDLQNMFSGPNNPVDEMANKMLQGKAMQPVPYYDLHITDDEYENMEITLGLK